MHVKRLLRTNLTAGAIDMADRFIASGLFTSNGHCKCVKMSI